MRQRFCERFDTLADKEQGRYDKRSALASLVKGRELRHFSDLARTLEPGTALDMGCGTGLYSEVLCGLGWRVLSCDMSAGMLCLARERLGGWAVRAEAEFPPVRPFSLDLVLLFDLLHYFTARERARVITACAAVLGPGGRMVLDVKNRWCPYYLLSGWAGRHESPHVETYTVSETTAFLEAAGLRPAGRRGAPWNVPMAPIVMLWAQREKR